MGEVGGGYKVGHIALDKRGYPEFFFFYFSMKTYIVGTH